MDCCRTDPSVLQSFIVGRDFGNGQDFFRGRVAYYPITLVHTEKIGIHPSGFKSV